MKVTGYLVISSMGQLRATKRMPDVGRNELAVKLSIEVPDGYFQRMWPSVQLTLPEAPAPEVSVRIDHADA